MSARAIGDEKTRRIGLSVKVLLALIAPVAIGVGVSLFARCDNDVGTCIANALSTQHQGKDSLHFAVILTSWGSWILARCARTIAPSESCQTSRASLRHAGSSTPKEIRATRRYASQTRTPRSPYDERSATLRVPWAGAQVSLKNGKGSCVTIRGAMRSFPRRRSDLSIALVAGSAPRRTHHRQSCTHLGGRPERTDHSSSSGTTNHCRESFVSCNEQFRCACRASRWTERAHPSGEATAESSLLPETQRSSAKAPLLPTERHDSSTTQNSLESLRAVVSAQGGNGAPESHTLDLPLDDIAIVRWGCPCVVRFISITQPRPGEGSNGNQLTIEGQVRVEGASDPAVRGYGSS